MPITITSDWGRIGPLWWINSNTEGVVCDGGWRWHYWGQVRLGGAFQIQLRWITL